jgi:hypothetical protein
MDSVFVPNPFSSENLEPGPRIPHSRIEWIYDIILPITGSRYPLKYGTRYVGLIQRIWHCHGISIFTQRHRLRQRQVSWISVHCSLSPGYIVVLLSVLYFIWLGYILVNGSAYYRSTPTPTHMPASDLANRLYGVMVN